MLSKRYISDKPQIKHTTQVILKLFTELIKLPIFHIFQWLQSWNFSQKSLEIIGCIVPTQTKVKNATL